MPSDSAHERVVFCHDRDTGLRAIVAIHSTVLGPALGGTRFYPYVSEQDAVTDVLRLSRGMTYKAAVAGVDLGGGKAVIIGDPTVIKTPTLLEAYGRFVESLGGTYVTAGDVGTNSDDLDIVAEETAYVVGKNTTAGGTGDSGPQTALGVYLSLLAAAESTWGSDDLTGRRVGVEGAGKVGYNLVALLRGAGADVLVSDSYEPALERIAQDFPGVTIGTDIIGADIDVYAPCAMGATLDASSVDRLSASIVCGAANNQLLTPDVESLLAARGIVWVPDYVANAGGLIQVEGELRGRNSAEVMATIGQIRTTVAGIFAMARSEGILLGAAADRLAEKRIAAARG
ncbi:Glu/Leu/Phe/Val family dehydrogenase [Rhodococcoides fascians]|uniref:Glu/Leu/Phe/Val family dehydrogenase n=1 Tax=Rhodococcoides fascians TaxID=1828 RepID=UPI00068E8A73|nr:Glu/Leu/Phe/Val dehydrogenase dimerization domain-containing protein [Rhodococcus fascians]